jgi:AAA15 family ATPase/GTPase
MSENTPAFFAIDNIDASLNPKLCRHLIKNLYVLAQKYGKQVILTTHNPAVLDGLNLTDENQKLFVIYRDDEGATRAKAIEKKAPVAGKAPIKLSEAFMRGYLGGLPEGF